MVNLFQYRNWAIHEGIFLDVAPRVFEMLAAGKGLETIFSRASVDSMVPRLQALLAVSEEGSPSPKAITIDQTSRLPVVPQNGKNIALIPIIGALSKYTGFCGEPGMQDFQAMIAKANASPGIDGIVLIMDSPGGTVDGTPELGLAINTSLKPVGVFGDQMVASAAYWLASQAKVIVGNKNNPTEFGSIGVFMISQNWQNMIDAGMKPKLEIIRAPQSTDKAKVNPVEELGEETRAEINDHLRDTANAFFGTVKAGRGEKLNTKLPGLFTGRMFDANTAKQNGMIDSVGTLQTAVNKVAELARQQSKEGTNSTNNKSANTMKFPKATAFLLALFGVKKEGKEVTLKVASDGVTSDDTASMEAAEQKVAEMEAENARLTADNSAKDQKITELNASVTSLTAEKATLTTKVAELQTKVDAKPAGEKTTVIPAEDKAEVKSDKYKTSVDAEADQIRKQNSNMGAYK